MERRSTVESQDLSAEGKQRLSRSAPGLNLLPVRVMTDLLEVIHQRGALHVAVEGTYPPFTAKTIDGDLVGYDVDVATALAIRLNVKPVFITTEWSGIMAGLKSGKYDLVVNQVTCTPEREKVFDFSPPYTYSLAQLIQRKDDPRSFKTLADLKGHKLGVTLGCNYDALAKCIAGVEVRTYPGVPEYLSDLVTGRVDAVLNDRLMLAYLLKTAPLPLRPGALIGQQSEAGIPFNKGNPKFAQALASAMKALKTEGILSQLSEKWFGVDVSQPLIQ